MTESLHFSLIFLLILLFFDKFKELSANKEQGFLELFLI